MEIGRSVASYCERHAWAALLLYFGPWIVCGLLEAMP